MEKIIIKVHSFIDVITNSSTEIFMLDTDKAVETIRDIIKEKEKEFPPEDWGSSYGALGYAYVEPAEDYQISEAFGYVDEENAINYLKAKGYEVTKKEDAKNYICIKTERGYMNPGLIKFINETFTVIYHDTDS